MKFDFDHIDPRTGLPRIKKSSPESRIHLMSQFPMRSGWIKMLQNRINLNSVGNIRYADKVWYDRRNHLVSKDMNGTDGVPFRRYILKCGQLPKGWIEE